MRWRRDGGVDILVVLAVVAILAFIVKMAFLS